MNTLALVSSAPASATPAQGTAPGAPAAPGDAGFAALLGQALAPVPTEAPAATAPAADAAPPIETPAAAPSDDPLPHKHGKPGALRRGPQRAAPPANALPITDLPAALARTVAPAAPAAVAETMSGAQAHDDEPADTPSQAAAPGLDIAREAVEPRPPVAPATARGADPAAGVLPPSASERAVAAVQAAPRGRDGATPVTRASAAADKSGVAMPAARADAAPAADADVARAALADAAPDKQRVAPRTLDAAAPPASAAAQRSADPQAATKAAERAQRESAAHAAWPPERTTPGALPVHAAADNAPPMWPAMAGLPALHAAPRHEAPAVVQAHISASPETAAFAPALATQVRWFVEDGVTQAQLNLHPAELGPVAVRIVLDGTQARIDFTAELAATRGAIESSLPALAASLAEGGLTLAGGGVFDGSPSQQQQPHGSEPHARPAARATIGRDAADEAPHPHDDGGARHANVGTARGLVDLVA